MVKEFRGGSQLHFRFRREDTAGLGFEEALEQIAAWAASAADSGAAWGLEIGDVCLELGRGAAHLRRSFELLAVARDVKPEARERDLPLAATEEAMAA